MSNCKFIKMALIAFLFSGILFQSCSLPYSLVTGNYYSQGEYIVEQSNSDGWRKGHYLLTIDSSNTFELKEVSYNTGGLYTICSGYLQRVGRNSFKLKKIKTNYSYGVLGNPYFNNTNYKITIKNKETIILRKGQWETPLLFTEPDSIPDEFDFKKYGYDMDSVLYRKKSLR